MVIVKANEGRSKPRVLISLADCQSIRENGLLYPLGRKRSNSYYNISFIATLLPVASSSYRLLRHLAPPFFFTIQMITISNTNIIPIENSPSSNFVFCHHVNSFSTG